MRIAFNGFLIGFIVLVFHPVVGQQRTMKPTKPIICYQSNKNTPDYVYPPEAFRQWKQNRSKRVKTASFEVEYINFPSDNLARNAFQFAVDIWETQLISPVTIKLRAQWSSLDAGVLGQAIWGTAYANFDGAQHMNTFYPVALAEKIAGHELNEAPDADIVASINSGTSWYFGTDGNTPTGKMDLVTIVLHEIAHGLGFTDAYNVEADKGSVGLQNGGQAVPFVFDLFVENNSGQRLFISFVSPSVQLKDQLISNNIFYNSPLAMANGGILPKLYAPTTWNDGSSISHLDEATYNTQGDPNKLMTPQIAFMEAIHEPGSILLNMFSDMGWVMTRIEHEPLKDTERKDGAPYNVKAKIVSDNGYLQDQIKLNYTVDNINFTVVTMTPTGIPNEFQGELPGMTNDGAYGYFISVTDNLNRPFTNPGKIQTQNQQPQQDLIVFNIGPDTDGPEIVHTPVDYIFEGETKLELSAEVTDNIGVNEVWVEYNIKDAATQTLQMQKALTPENTYTVTIDVPAGLVIGDLIGYRIVANDISTNANVGASPDNGLYTVFVTGIMPAQDMYVNDFNALSTDFIGNSFSITTHSGFDNGAIHSKHPYDDGSGPNDESNYIFQLQIPIRINADNPFIRFDEIVLVEPGEDGSVFGDTDFYDYVIVEGSNDGATTWVPFADGYDSRSIPAWLTQYNSNISNNNSQTPGTPSLFRERTISMLAGGDFSEGDEVLIRFRLFADQAAHGWGWAIDNLFIQNPVTGIEQSLNSVFNVYPNPAKKNITVEVFLPAPSVRIQILNLQGQVVFKGGSESQVSEIDIGSYREGLYLIKAECEGRTFIRRFLKLNE